MSMYSKFGCLKRDTTFRGMDIFSHVTVTIKDVLDCEWKSNQIYVMFTLLFLWFCEWLCFKMLLWWPIFYKIASFSQIDVWSIMLCFVCARVGRSLTTIFIFYSKRYFQKHVLQYISFPKYSCKLLQFIFSLSKYM